MGSGGSKEGAQGRLTRSDDDVADVDGSEQYLLSMMKGDGDDVEMSGRDVR